MISIIMSVYKEELSILEQAIDSILKQTYSEFEFIIINDNPLDVNLKDYLCKKAMQDLRIKLITNHENIGLVKSLNRALKECDGDYIARMDADDVASVDRLEKQLNWMIANGTDVLGTFVDYINANGEVITNCNKQIYKKEQLKKIIRYVNYIYHPTWMVRKSIYDELNGYRDIKACEDYDFLLRANQKNKKIEICDSTLLYYRISEQGISHIYRYEQLAIMQFLQKKSGVICELSIDKINSYQKRIKEDMRAQRFFYKANVFHERALVMKRKKRNIYAVLYMICAAGLSPIFLKLYINILKAKICV